MKQKKTQIILIHGGMTFKNKKNYQHYLKTRDISIKKDKYWNREYINKELKDNFEIIKPLMPSYDNANYDDWRIHFERYSPYFKDNLILIGWSLGGIFLAKYLSENKFQKKIKAIYLIGAPYDNTLPTEDLVNGFKLKSNLSLLEKNCEEINLLFSEDDNVVPVSHAEKYKTKLKKSKIIIYKNKKGHFKINKFPELIKLIKKNKKS
jgi:predicted alpha/beta hydrolase family esterase